jgi:hypothetical protein
MAHRVATRHVGFWGEADINRQAKLAGSVENDPGCVKTPYFV